MLISIFFILQSNAIVIKQLEIDPNKYVIMLGSFVRINDAQNFANQFKKEKIFIFKDKNLYTVRVVNINTKNEAIYKLNYLRKTVPDVILWKKMDFINQRKFSKLNSEIHTIKAEILEVNDSN